MTTASADRGAMTASWQHQREALAFVKDKRSFGTRVLAEGADG